MTTFNSKRFAKLAGILKEETDALSLQRDRQEDRNLIADENRSENEQEVRDIIRQMNAKAKEGVGPNDFLLLLDPDAMINSGINTPEKLRKYFADEKEREDYKASLHSHGGQDDDRRELETRYDELFTAKHDRGPGDVSNMSDEELMSEIEELEEELGVTERKDKVSPENDEDPYYELEDRLGPGGKHGMSRPTMESKKSNKKVLSSSTMSISLKAAMKSCDHLNECGCQMEKAPFDAPEDEPQGYMLVQNLKKLAAKAAELSTMANHDDDAEPWVESKINSAAHHIDAIYDYIKYGRPSEDHMMHEPKSMPHDDFSDLDVHMANTYEENE